MPRMAGWLPGAALASIALLQLLLSQTHHLSPWLGGGFGMFASLDSPMNRGFDCEGTDEHGNRVPIHLTFSGRGAEREFDADRRFRILTLPRDSELRPLAQMLLEAELVPDTAASAILNRFSADAALVPRTVYRVRLPGDPAIEGNTAVRLRAVRVDVWRLSFDAASGRLGRTHVTGFALDDR